MPKDPLQIFAAEELSVRKWKYNVENNVWFKKIEQDSSTTPSTDYAFNTTTADNEEDYEFFHPYEWKVMKYVYGKVNQSKFLPESEISKYKGFLLKC